MDNQEKPKRYTPRNAVLELTLACRMRCLHCGSSAGQPRPDELDTAEWIEVVRELGELGCETLTLSGGEPTLREDWDRVARAASARGIYVNMITSGAYPPLIATDVARRARDAGLGNVGLSLDGTKTVHDRIRGRGAFGWTLASAERFSGAGVPVALITTLSQLNLAHLEATGELAARLGACSWTVQLAKPMGNLAPHLTLSAEQLLGLMPRLARLKRELPLPLFIGDSIGYFGPLERTLRRRDWRGRPTAWKGCQAGLSVLGVESDGAVKGCLSLQARREGVDPFVEGNLRAASLSQIRRRPGAFAYNREPHELRGHCADCGHGPVCRGGARCMAAALSGGRELSWDPLCYRGLTGEPKQPGHARWIAAAAAAAALFSLALPEGGVASPGSSHDTKPSRYSAGGSAKDAGPSDQGGEQPSAVAEYSVAGAGCAMVPLGRR